MDGNLAKGGRVIVVGGGFAGLSIAARLSQTGLPVTLLEATQLGFESSTRNQGWLHSGALHAARSSRTGPHVLRRPPADTCLLPRMPRTGPGRDVLHPVPIRDRTRVLDRCLGCVRNPRPRRPAGRDRRVPPGIRAGERLPRVSAPRPIVSAGAAAGIAGPEPHKSTGQRSSLRPPSTSWFKAMDRSTESCSDRAKSSMGNSSSWPPAR